MDKRFRDWMALDRATRDFQLSPSQSAKDATGVLTAMVAETEAARADPALESRCDIAYGDGPAARLDLYRPAKAEGPLPCLVFLHGGFWQEGDKSVSGYAARALAKAGWASVGVGYPLTPGVSLTELTQQVHEALRFIHDAADRLGIDPERIVLAGHSAGGHLAASVVADIFGTGIAARICGAVLISGVFELAPIAASYVNDLARMTEGEIAALSPLRFAPARQMPLHVLVGADEPEAFRMQSEVLAASWAGALPALESWQAPGRDHFDILHELTDPASPTRRAMETMVASG